MSARCRLKNWVRAKVFDFGEIQFCNQINLYFNKGLFYKWGFMYIMLFIENIWHTFF